jgi:outer membrane protein TolC
MEQTKGIRNRILGVFRNAPRRRGVSLFLSSLLALSGGCARLYREDADRVAATIIEKKQTQAMGQTEPFTIEPPADALRRRLLLAQKLPYSGPESLGSGALEPIAHWPERNYPPRSTASAPAERSPAPTESEEDKPLPITLTEALRIAARSNRDYQARKETIFREALDLDLEENEFRATLAGSWDAGLARDFTGEPFTTATLNTATAEVSQRFKSGIALTGRLVVDLVNLLTQEPRESIGLLTDLTITVPLLRGAGRHIAAEPITQAQRNVVYAIYDFERHKRILAVRVASEYLAVLQAWDQRKNAEENYRRLIAGVRRAQRLADSGRLPEIQVDQARQDELRARERWISAGLSHARQLDSFKQTLGLPVDARIELDHGELQRLAQAALEKTTGAADPAPTPQPETPAPEEKEIEPAPPDPTKGGPLEIDPAEATRLALKNRLDLRRRIDEVYDAQRNVVVTADALQMGLTLTGGATMGSRRGIGSAASADGRIRVRKGLYTAGLALDLPLERTAERNDYRESFISLESAVRDVQELEDDIKLSVRNSLRSLLEARESIAIQTQSEKLARRRVESTALFLQAGRAQIRDVLEAQEALVSAQDALTRALVTYRVSELELQRDMGLLEVSAEGLWKEFRPTGENGEQNE